MDVPDGNKTTPIPGGLEGTFTLKDLYWIKANPQYFDPNSWSDPLHTKFMAKILRTYQPERDANGRLNPVDVYNWLVFAMQSPNMPLTQNQLVHSVIRAHTDEDISRMASMKGMSDQQIATAFNIQAKKKGGMGLRGSPNLKSVAEFAHLYLQNPDWFQKRPNETDMQLTERLSTAIKGLALKTASFGTVWQNPSRTEVAPMDRHMINEGLETVNDPALKQRMINLWNKAHPDDPIKRWSKLLRWNDSRSFTINRMMGALTPRKAKLTSAKTGETNPNVPEHLAKEEWIETPGYVNMLSDPYRALLERNVGLAKARGLGLYGSQWLEWNDIRGRIDPHESQYPGTREVPPMPEDWKREIDKAHGKAGWKGSNKDAQGRLPKPKPTANPSALTYFSVPMALAAGMAAQAQADRKKREWAGHPAAARGGL